jgi:hypothetical protein
MLSLLRRSLLVIFCASIVFILAGGGLQKMTEDAAFHQAAQNYSSVGVSFEFVLIGAAGLLLAIVTGGLPILSSIIQSALRHRRYSTLLLLAVPVVAFAVFLGTTLLLEASTSPSGFFAPEGQALLHRGIFLGVLLIGAIASVWAVCFAVVRSEIPAEILRFTLLPAILGIIAMVLITAATLVWGLSLRASVPELFNGNSGMFRSSTSLSWIRLVIAMVLTTVVAAISLKRGFSARSVLRTSTT